MLSNIEVSKKATIAACLLHVSLGSFSWHVLTCFPHTCEMSLNYILICTEIPSDASVFSHCFLKISFHTTFPNFSSLESIYEVLFYLPVLHFLHSDHVPPLTFPSWLNPLCHPAVSVMPTVPKSLNHICAVPKQGYLRPAVLPSFKFAP